MRHIFSCLILICVSVIPTETVKASLIERSVIIDLETDGRIIPFSPHPAWEGVVDVEKFALQTGDQLMLRIQFANHQHLQLGDDGNNTELTKLTLLFEEPSGVSWRTSGTYTYTGVMGELLTNPTFFDRNGGGGAYQGPFNHENLTNSSFVYHGIDFMIDIESWGLREGPGIFDHLEWSSSAQQVSIGEWEAIPEPATVFLMGIGLAGLGFARRRKTKQL